MKKSFIFASLIAVVAIFASCQPKGDAPKARFTYEVEGLTVTFTNASKDAESYVWDFGDGSAVSTEENPVHEYAAEGNYSVKLTAKNQFGENAISDYVVIEKPLFILKVDGNFSDWDALPAELLAVAEVNDMAVYEDLYKIKFISDRNRIYFYMEFNGEEGAVWPIDMMINTGNEGGMSTWLWENSNVNILIEGVPFVYDDVDDEGNPAHNGGYADAGIFKFIGATPEDWAWDALDIAGAMKASAVVDLGNGAKAFEGSILRASLPSMNEFHVGVFCSDADWAETGALPQLTVAEEGSTAQPMLKVILN